MKNKKPSLRKLYKEIILLVIPVSIVVVVMFMHIRDVIVNQVVSLNRAEIENRIDNLDATCSNVNYSLIRMLGSDSSIQVLIEEADEIKRDVAIRELKTKFANMREQSLAMCNYFFLDMEKDDYIFPVQGNDIQQQYQRKKFIYQYITQNANHIENLSKSWKLCLTEQEKDDFIIKLYRLDHFYIGCWIPIEKIYENFGVNQYSDLKSGMMFVQNGEVVTESERYMKMTKTRKLGVSRKNPTTLSGNYAISWYSFSKGDFSFVFGINVLDKFQSLQTLVLILISIVVFILAAGIFLLIYVQKKLLKPIDYFVNHLSLENILEKKNNEDYEQPYFVEMAQVDEMFKNAATQIVNLKVAMYESEMEKQQIEMEYLQKQIKPHFYVNCMNIIYSMAQFGKIDEIKKFSKEIAEYVRGIFRRSNEPITLWQEICHVEKYLDINRVRYEDEFETEIYVEEEIKDCIIMPLVIHTFVENSIKHALYGREKLKIWITAERQIRDGNTMIYIQVRDNGKGFPEDVISALNNGELLKQKDGKRVGLSNTVKRIRIFWKETARIRFFNHPEGGAVSEILIPEEHMMERGK